MGVVRRLASDARPFDPSSDVPFIRRLSLPRRSFGVPDTRAQRIAVTGRLR
jgi:hypothetical protein